MTSFSAEDICYMRNALALGRQGQGKTADNPSVGCVIVNDGVILARARTANGGRPHAETQAIKQAGKFSEGATMYVTLEPCAHHGMTPPCAESIVNAKLKRVVIATIDSDKRVHKQGVNILKQKGVTVDIGCLENEAKNDLSGFILSRETGLLDVTLKMATSVDGKIATKEGDSKWITGPLARRYGHLERSQHDAIAVGIETALADDPSLTARLKGITHKGVRIVFDTHLRLPIDCKLVQTISDQPLWIVTTEDGHSKKSKLYEEKGVEILTVNKTKDNHCDILEALKLLSKRGVTRLLIEGGSGLITSFVSSGLYNRILWFKSSSVIGADGINAVNALGIKTIQDSTLWQHVSYRQFDKDHLDIYKKVCI